MADRTLPQTKSIHAQAFAHYLRTGQRLTNVEWLARCERKFNPYHDENGRFTSPPGVTVSWGSHRPAPARNATTPRPSAASGRRAPTPAQSQPPSGSQSPRDPVLPNARPSSGEFRSTFVRERVAQGGHADTFFELNKRQSALDRLREEAGPNADPATKADLAEIQKRLDADRVRLEEITRKVVDPATIDLLREGLPPLDTITGALNIAASQAELRDYLAVAAILPVSKIAKVAGRTAESGLQRVIPRGGAYSAVRKLKGSHAHHIPPKSVSPIPPGRGPSIAMLPADHRATLSYGRGAKNIAHREAQRKLIQMGDFRGAQQLDLDDIRRQFGSKYDDEIEEMLEYTKSQGFSS